MRAKVIIENGETTIVLTPENEFETDIIEKVHCKKEKHGVYTEFKAKFEFGVYTNYHIALNIKEERP